MLAKKNYGARTRNPALQGSALQRIAAKGSIVIVEGSPLFEEAKRRETP